MKNKKIFILLFIILLAYALLVGGTIPYFLLYIYILSFLIPILHILFVLMKLKSSVQLPMETLYTGEEIIIKYEIINNSIFHIPYLEIHSHISRDLTGKETEKIIKTLKPRESFKYNETINLKRRGYYEFGELEIKVSDVFGFFQIGKKFTSKTSLLVYPDIIELSNFTITTVEQLGELPVNDILFQDKSRISSIRNFREGDSIKSVHWKLSAKLDDVVVKEYENRGDTHTIILMDNYHQYFKNDINRRLEDNMVDISLSIINYYIAQNLPIELKTQNANELVEIYGHHRTDIKSFLDALAKFKANGHLGFPEFTDTIVNTFRKDSTIIILTPNLNKSIGALGLSLKSKGLKPLFIVITDKKNNIFNLETIVEKSLQQENIPVYLLDCESNIGEVLEDKNV